MNERYFWLWATFLPIAHECSEGLICKNVTMIYFQTKYFPAKILTKFSRKYFPLFDMHRFTLHVLTPLHTYSYIVFNKTWRRSRNFLFVYFFCSFFHLFILSLVSHQNPGDFPSNWKIVEKCHLPENFSGERITWRHILKVFIQWL